MTMRSMEIFMLSTVIGWIIYVRRHYCTCRAKIFYLPQPGNEPLSLDLQDIAVKFSFYRKAVEVYLYIP